MPEAEAGPKSCFVIAPIGDPDSEIRKRSDQVLKHVIQPAVKPLGYEAVRADQISEPGIITTQIIQHIIDDPLVVADLSGKNANVMYELALRHALRKPYVQLIQRGERIPFDVAAIRTVEVDHRDLDSVEAAKAEIARQVISMEGLGSDIDSPISVAVDLEVLRQSGNPEQRQLADVLAAVSELRSGLSLVEQRLGDPSALVPLRYLHEAMLPVMADLAERVRKPRLHPDAVAEILSLVTRLQLLLEPREGSGEPSLKSEEARETTRRLERTLEMLFAECMSPETLSDFRENLHRRKRTMR